MNQPHLHSGYRKAGNGTSFLIFRPYVVAVLLAMAAIVFAGAIAASMIGSVTTSVTAAFAWLIGTGEDELLAFIIGQLRLARILLALLCGAALGAAGAAMQSATRNGLADPGLIGVKEGTVITVVAMLLLFPQAPAFWRPLLGLVGGGAVAITVIGIARSVSGLRFVLIGIGVSWLLSSVIALFMTMAAISEVQTAMIWLGGSLHAASWLDLKLALPWTLAGFAILFATTRSADTAMLGDMAAVGLGIRLRQLNAARLFSSVLLTSACASVVGGLGFVGLIAPHLARLCFGSSQMPLLFGSAVFGSLLVLAADTIGRTVFAPIQIPAGILMAILGLPFFVGLMWQRRDAL
ncbi:iron ABC transporter permease [Aliirhizobium smilacinae]|uniref:Iron ABC transporter permease n=1 Tax=Aliirhizobium smilacinae TaxID=1395944 RepID=A0A5C4XJW0_9HYPH|nr:iron ABC transporter permease [Rhizobium smilacinae]